MQCELAHSHVGEPREPGVKFDAAELWVHNPVNVLRKIPTMLSVALLT